MYAWMYEDKNQGEAESTARKIGLVGKEGE